ncbi:MAG: hypothetical protein KDA42_05415 [Planctomycetales bacterium]|nr:hypothetical protein [Planctomycetales bacterium]
MAKRISRRQRRGVLILVVMSLLVLFLLAAVAFVLNSSQQHTAAKASARKSLAGDQPNEQLDEALRTLLRGRAGTGIEPGDSLLGDMFGSTPADVSEKSGWVEVKISQVVSLSSMVADKQFFDMAIETLPAGVAREELAGRTIVFLTGPRPFASGRIIPNPEPDTADITLRIFTNDFALPNPLPNATAQLATYPGKGDRAWINAVPFDNQADNEDYDAADNENLHLAAVYIDHNELHVIPSFDRSQTGGPAKSPFPLYDASRNPGGVWDATSNPYPWHVDNDGDGYADSVWLDLGFPVQRTRDGRLYKPMFAILCTDLDGRLNVNAAGTRDHLRAAPAAATLANGSLSSELPRGSGLGPAEIHLGAMFGAEYRKLVAERYGMTDAANVDTVAPRRVGAASRVDVRFMGAPNVFNAAFTAYASPFDGLGRYAAGLDDYGRVVYEPQQLSEPQIVGSPYGFDLSRNVAGGETMAASDAPYAYTELEALLRYYDHDAASLTSRLRSHFPTTFRTSSDAAANRLNATTASFDVPTVGSLRTELISRVAALVGSSRAAYRILGPDFATGGRFNLNIPFGDGVDNDGDGVVDESGETEDLWANITHATFAPVITPDRDNDGTLDTAEANDPVDEAKQHFANRIYVILDAIYRTNNGAAPDADAARIMAQWAVNVVDFRDFDSIMTRFQYGGGANEVVWGCERPELLLTETLAWHDRATEDTADETPDNDENGDGAVDDKDKGKQADGEDEDFDQKRLPRSGFFVELYNPWKDEGKKSTDLYRATATTGVELNKRSPGGSPVWRIAVDTTVDPDDDPDTRAASTIDRSVYFVNPAGLADTGDGTRYYPSTAVTQFLPAGHYAVVGSSGDPDTPGTSLIGSSADATTSPPRRIVLAHNTYSNNAVLVTNNEAANSDDAHPMGTDSAALAVAIDTNASIGGNVSLSGLSISEPSNGYTAAGWDATQKLYTTVKDVPLDTVPSLMEDGTHEGFRMVHLQRLANPLKDWNSVTNPYLTIDSMHVDLTCFNGETNDMDSNAAGGPPTAFTTLQRGDTAAAGVNALWAYEANPAAGATAGRDPNHYFDEILAHSLGFLNDAYQTDPANPHAENQPDSPFPWLAWLNRPFTSQLELMLVPKTSSSRLPVAFSFYNGTDPTKSFSHLVNFYHNDYKVFRDFLEVSYVPSRFVGTRTTFNPEVFQTSSDAGVDLFRPPFNHVPSLREPGKINLNTIYNESTYNALMHIGVGTPRHPGPTWAEFVTSRREAFNADPATVTATDEIISGSGSSFFQNPFRSFNADERQKTLLRNHPTATTPRPMFANTSLNEYNDASRNPFFFNQSVQRLANLTTTRSNVYAVWITVGYFETSPAGGLSGITRELGSDQGDSTRHRAFYIVDRSLPVAFEPGKDHNVDDAVVLRTFIE